MFATYVGPGVSPNVPDTYITPSVCLFLSSNPFCFLHATLHKYLALSLYLYLLFWILLASLEFRKWVYGVVTLRLRRSVIYTSDDAPSLKLHTAKAQVISKLDFPRKISLGQYFQTVECRDSFAFWVYPWRHFPGSPRLPRGAYIGFEQMYIYGLRYGRFLVMERCLYSSDHVFEVVCITYAIELHHNGFVVSLFTSTSYSSSIREFSPFVGVLQSPQCRS